MKQFFDDIAKNWDEMEHSHEDVFMPLLRELDIRPGDRVLDIACGTGVITGHLQQLCGSEVVGIDFSEQMIAIAQAKHSTNEHIRFVCADFLQWAEESEETYDYAVIYNAYPHFLEPAQLSRQLQKILAPEGRFAIVHSQSVVRLNAHHAKMEANGAGHFSRMLQSAQEECRWFEDRFAIQTIRDDEKGYMITGRRK